MKLQKSNAFCIACVALFIFVFLVTSQSWAEIYKWQDTNGKTHFTDNLMEIPSDFLTEEHLEEMQMKGLVDPEEAARKKQLKADQERKKLAREQAAKRQREREKRLTITAEERKVLSYTSFFLQNNIIAYKKHLGKPVGEELFKNLKNITQISIKPKTKLIEQLSQFESQVSKQTLKFLKASLATDKEFGRTEVYIKPNAETLIARLKNETAGKGNIIKVIQRALASSSS